MRTVVIGLGTQGKKRAKVAGTDLVATIDPVATGVDFRAIEHVPLDRYDAALVCTPDNAKPAILSYLLENQKHILVEKPLLGDATVSLAQLKALAERQKVACYTAYNHRFEPHIVRLKKILDAGWLGKIYRVKFFYGNGTARDVRNSAWRDSGMGVLSDIGSHLLDWTLFLFGPPDAPARTWSADRCENRAYDHYQFGFPGKPAIDYEMSLLSWRNTFRLDLFAENGSVHVDGLCKWGPSTYTQRHRVLPSGRPTEESSTLICTDPTWEEEYRHFCKLCQSPATNLANDIWISSVLQGLAPQPPP